MTVEHPPAPLVVVTPWRRYGHQRAYVKVDDVDAGYRDLLTGSVQCTDPRLTDVIARATNDLYERAVARRKPDYAARHAAAEPPTTTTPRTVESAVETALLPDRDLSLHRPGQGARERALELRAEAPVRTFVARLTGAKTPERAWRIGADGEGLVADRLARLGNDWLVLHAIPVGERGSDIDHVVIGPSGVFTVNAKNHPQANVWTRGDTFMVNGAKNSYVRNSRFEAARAARLLSEAAGFDVDVRGIIAVVGAQKGLRIKEQPHDGRVLVTARKRLVDLIRHEPNVLGAASVARIAEVARHLSTWQPRTVAYQAFPD